MIIYTTQYRDQALSDGEGLMFSRIGHQNYLFTLSDSAVTVSTEDPDGPKDAPLRPETYEYWMPTTLPAYWEIDLGQEQIVDYIGIAGHTLGQEACTITVRGNTSQNYDAYVSFPGTSNNRVSTTDSTSTSITGDIDIRVRVTMDDWTPGTIAVLCGKYAATGDDRGWTLEVDTSGQIRLWWTPDGTLGSAVIAFMENTGIFTDGTDHWLRVTLDVDDGAGNWDASFYTSTDGDTWDLESTDTGVGATSIYDSSAPLTIGGTSDNTNLWSGNAHFFQLRNGIDGIVVAEFDANDPGRNDTEWESLTTGETWTILQSGTTPAELISYAIGERHIATDDAPLLYLDDARAMRYIRIDVDGSSNMPKIPVIYIGVALVMEREVANSFTPINLSAETTLDLQLSQGGQFLSQHIRREGFSSSIVYTLLTPEWVRGPFLSFINAAKTYPYFFAWNPLDETSDVGYCWSGDNIKPSYMGDRDWMRVSWNMMGLG